MVVLKCQIVLTSCWKWVTAAAPLPLRIPTASCTSTTLWQVENIEKVLDGVRPFLSVAGGSIKIHSLTGVSSIQVRNDNSRIASRFRFRGKSVLYLW